MDKKVARVINMYTRLTDGEVLIKAEEANRFNVNERTIERDIEDIRQYLASDYTSTKELVYDKTDRNYCLVEREQKRLTNSEIFSVIKILLESRSLVKEEMMPIIDKLVQCCAPQGSMKKVSELIKNEKFHYLEPHHGKKFVDTMWDIGSAVYEQKLIKMRYRKLKEADEVPRRIEPVGIMFSEYYFYLTAYICADEDNPDVVKHPFPTIYRIDRIQDYEILNEHFQLPYIDRFQEGEFRKRIQFMFGGELRRIKFLYKGLSIEAVLDRFPTAEVVRHDEKGYIITAEVYGDGVDIWLRGQGDIVDVIDDGKGKENG